MFKSLPTESGDVLVNPATITHIERVTDTASRLYTTGGGAVVVQLSATDAAAQLTAT
jgi:hypothetical protein